MGKLNYGFTKATRLWRNTAGNVIAREQVDPTTIYQLLNERGEIPEPPYPAYQQFVDGVPGALFTVEELEVEPPFWEQING